MARLARRQTGEQIDIDFAVNFAAKDSAGSAVSSLTQDSINSQVGYQLPSFQPLLRSSLCFFLHACHHPFLCHCCCMPTNFVFIQPRTL